MFNQTQDKPSEHIDDPQANTEAPVLSEGYGEHSRETQKAPQQKESISTQHTKSNSNERRVVSAMLTPSMNLNINTMNLTINNYITFFRINPNICRYFICIITIILTSIFTTNNCIFMNSYI